jgi:very-short-patch-repair endonuclease
MNVIKTEECVNRAKIIHGDMYDYSQVVYKNQYDKILIKCKQHGLFYQIPKAHWVGQGCPICGQIQRTNSLRKKTTTDFISEAKDKHGFYYDYSDVKYINTYHKVIIKCPNHGKFLQTPKIHLKGHGCPKCKFKKSKGERTVENFLMKNGIEFESEKQFEDCKNIKPLRFDFYLPKLNVLIEYDGEQHAKANNKFHKNKASFVKTQFRDEIKNQFAKNNDMRLIRIAYKQWNQQPRIENELRKELLSS